MRVFGIINYGDRPHASKETLEALRKVAQENCEEAVLEPSTSIEHSARLVKQAEEEGFDTLLIGGGDGTINVLLNQVMGKNFKIGLLPLGTTNALAHTLNIPQNPIEALKAALNGKSKKIDVGQVNERYFLCFASIGFDAATVHSIPKETKRLLGTFAFILHGIGQLFHLHLLPKFRAMTFPNKERIRAYSAIISNISVYAGFKLFHNIQIDSGDFEAYFFNSNKAADYALYALSFVIAGQNPARFFDHVKNRTFEELFIKARKPLYLQIDGEPVKLEDNKRLHFKILKGALDFIFPPEADKT